MPAVANIRVNTQVPFPASVTGAGPVMVAKSSGGAWTVGLSFAAINSTGPTVTEIPFQQILIYDTVQKSFFTINLNDIGIPGSAGLQRSVTASPIVISTIDQIINVNVSTGTVSCALPTAFTRNGVGLTFKDVGGNAAAHNITLTAAAGDTIDGSSTFVMNTNRQVVRLVPFTDGVNVGWFID